MLPVDLIKRYFWVVNVAFVVMAAFLSASVINGKVRAKIDQPPEMDIKSIQQVATNPSPRLEDYNVIIDRNVFNSASVLTAQLKKSKGDVPVNTTCDLIGTVAWNPERSLALIQLRSGGKVQIYKVGDDLESGGKVVDIRRGEVTISINGKDEVLRLPSFDLAERLKSGGGSLESVADGIRKAGDGDFVVDRRVIENSMDNMGQLMRQARIMPHLVNGQIDGFTVSRIKNDSLYSNIGLQNGDVIKKINGIEFSGPEDFLKVFEVLRSARSIDIEVLRGGKNQAMSYSIR